MSRDARDNTGKFDCQVEGTNYSNYYYMDVHFSAKMFPTKINELFLLFKIH